MKTFYVTYTSGSENFIAYTTIYYDPDIANVISGNIDSHCDLSQISVIGLDPNMTMPAGVDVLPVTLQANTLYILQSGAYAMTRPAGLDFGGNCITLLGTGTVSIYNTGAVGSLVTFPNRSYDIINNITVDGRNLNTYNIFMSSASGNTIKNSKIINASYGMYLNSSNNNTIDNTEIFNHTTYGIYMRP